MDKIFGLDVAKWARVYEFIGIYAHGDIDIFIEWLENQSATIQKVSGENLILKSKLKRIQVISNGA